MTLRDLARTVLSESLLPLTARQVWEEAVKRGLDKQVETKGKTPWATVSSYLTTSAKKPGSGIVATGANPMQFSLHPQTATERSGGSGAPPPSVGKPSTQTKQKLPKSMKEEPAPAPAKTEPTVWGIHSRDDGLFRHENRIAIGWAEMGDLAKIPNSRDAFKARFAQVYPDSKKAAIPTGAGMLYRFTHEVNLGDYVVYPSKEDRKINIGIVEGGYTFDPVHHYSHQRKVKWLKHISRDLFSPAALYEVGSAMTFFSVKSFASEFLSALSPDFKKKVLEDDPESATAAITADGILDSTKDFILKELKTNLKGFALEEFVADLLQAMGYRTTLSKKGGDGGVDITAYKDELPPRILVQVKSQDGDINKAPVAQLKGDMKSGDYGLFVTLSNYNDKALEFLAENPSLRGINGGELADLILKYYANLNERFQKTIPLKMAYVPAPTDGKD